MEDYFQLMKVRPDLFINPDYESSIRIETDPKKILIIQKRKAKELVCEGKCPENAQVGIVYHDQYLMILRDAVIFPNGETGTYIRIVNENKDTHGVVILPKLGNHWVTVEHFRHTTRGLEIEIPRGFGEKHQSPEENAIRELKEELDCSIQNLYPLGTLVENSGISNAETNIFLADIDSIGEPDMKEGIERIVLYSTAEMISLIKDNRIKDMFTVFAVFKAYLLGYLPLQ